MNRIWNGIQEDIEDKCWDTNGLADLAYKNLDYVVFKEPLAQDPDKPYCTLLRHGDVLVGFYLDPAATTRYIRLELTIGKVSLPDLEINPGEFRYFFENTHPFPIISAMHYSETRISCKQGYDGLYAIYAIIGKAHLRRQLAQTTNVLQFRSGKTAVIRGHFMYLKDSLALHEHFENNSYIHLMVPDMGAASDCTLTGE